MRFGNQRESGNIEDRRGARIPGGGVAIGGIGTIVVVLLGLFLGVDPSTILEMVEGGAPQQQSSMRPTGDSGAFNGQPTSPADEQQRHFVSQVLGSTEDTWHTVFAASGRTYQEPVLVLFSGATQSACGFAQAAIGPFYCPGDRKLYLDLNFLQRLQARLGARGDFAEAYVIAHEIGHHVQTLLGITQQATALRRRGDPDLDREVSIRVELQADCFAGVWANRANAAHGILERGDIEQGITAAGAVGDDNVQMRTRGYVVPESFTHGSASQRVRWFRTGLESGDMKRCDTFNAAQL